VKDLAVRGQQQNHGFHRKLLVKRLNKESGRMLTTKKEGRTTED
jgi:hypothetical protein